MAFTTNLSGTAQVDSSLIQAYDQAFLVANAQTNVMDQLVETRFDIGAKAISFPKFSQLALVTAPLSETEDVASEALADEQVILTPKEYGKVVTTTQLASLQTGGTVDLAAARLVGTNMARSKDALAIQALSASVNVIGDGLSNITGATLNTFYNKLARTNVEAAAGGEYVMVAHDDVIADLREETGSGSWIDVVKYATPDTALKNEVGMYKGFRVIRNNHAAADAGVYNVYFMGANALGLAVSKEAGMVATGPFDKLARFVNLGWYGVFSYGIVDADAVWVGKHKSSKA